MKGRGPMFDAIVTVASWEPRFLLGLKRTLRESAAKRVLAYFVGEYSDRTEQAREELRGIVEEAKIELQEEKISFSRPAETWSTLERGLGPNTTFEGPVLLDLTTMPREIIWSTLFWLEASRVETHYVYGRPEAYAEDWLAKDPDHPRLVYKLAGTLEVDQATALVAVTGFDERRCRQAVEFYEPTRALLAAQTGSQYKNDARNIGPEFELGGVHVEHIEMNAFSADHGYAALRQPVAELARSHNIILCSFGPKPSAIALFRLQRECPRCALAYIGCKEYSLDYSRGLGDMIGGRIDWRRDQE